MHASVCAPGARRTPRAFSFAGRATVTRCSPRYHPPLRMRMLRCVPVRHRLDAAGRGGAGALTKENGHPNKTKQSETAASGEARRSTGRDTGLLPVFLSSLSLSPPLFKVYRKVSHIYLSSRSTRGIGFEKRGFEKETERQFRSPNIFCESPALN